MPTSPSTSLLDLLAKANGNLTPGVALAAMHCASQNFTSLQLCLPSGAWPDAMDWLGRRTSHDLEPRALQAWLRDSTRAACFITQNQVQVVTPSHPLWPRGLGKGDQVPLLYVLGSLPDPALPNIALVGSRASVEYGSPIAASLATFVAEHGGVVLSGGAAGIDSAAHQAAVEAEAPTTAIMGTWLSRLYPTQNRELFQRIRQHGALVSQFPPNAELKAFSFLSRNRTIAAMCSALVVVQARRGSGALYTAQHAMRLQKPVFAVPGPMNDPSCFGSNQLLAMGAKPLYSFDLLTSSLGGRPSSSPPLPLAPKPRLEQKNLPTSLDPLAGNVLIALQEGGRHVDDLCCDLEVGPGELSRALLELELENLVCRLPGNRYKLALHV